MKIAKFNTLTPQQQHAMVLAIAIRNAMEDFHVSHLSDAQMAELNPIIRQALIDTIAIIEDDNEARQAWSMQYLISMIPDYWEVPEIDLR